MAFVIVQHLDPTRKGILPELLQRCTGMKVIQVRDRILIRSRCVYVIPPNKDMSLLRGKLYLIAPASPRGQRLPIDFFFHSLAQDQGEHAIGVVLSGMGSDGTLGLQTIKEKGGLTLVQDPATAKFDGMPHSAVNSGVADIVAPVNDLPSRLIAYLERGAAGHRPVRAMKEQTGNAIDKAVILLRIQTGHDFSLYKKDTLYRRIERRMGIHQINKIADYIRYLHENSQELDLLFKELLIGVTSFFRDRAVWDELRKNILPALIASRPPGHEFRAWLPGCSTGEEAYSLAMAFKEAMGDGTSRKKIRFKIFATDLDKDAISRARQGIYSESACAGISPKQISRFFTKDERGYRVISEIRELVVFAPQSLIIDPPFTKLDFLSCRNLLIYFMPEMQKKLMPLFHYSLGAGGILLLGGAETIGSFDDLFKPLNRKLRIFQRIGANNRTEPIGFPSSFTQPSSDEIPAVSASQPKINLQSAADHLVLEKYAPPAVLVNESGNILYISGRTGRYLEPAAGKANWNILAMAREGLRYELGNIFQKALDQKTAMVTSRIEFAGDAGPEHVEVLVQKLKQPEAIRGLMMIVFTAIPMELKTVKHRGRSARPASHQGLIEELNRKYQSARQEAQIVREEMQASQEELRSTNEELTTSREEMQSLNEELQTVNAELQAKLDELSRSNNDMKNLLNSTDIATLFLDDNLKVRRFTSQATKIIKLIPGDTGRPITDLSSDLLYPDLAADTQEVLQKLNFKEKSVETRDGRWFTVRIMPYRTLDNRIDGVVITFSDITVAKKLEAQLRERHAGLEKHIAGLPVQESHTATGKFAGLRRKAGANQSLVKIKPDEKNSSFHCQISPAAPPGRVGDAKMDSDKSFTGKAKAVHGQ